MRLLLLTPQLPYPPHQGTTLRNYNLIKQLSQRHAIHLFSLLEGGQSPEGTPLDTLVTSLTTAAQTQRTTGQRLGDLLTSSLPDLALRLWSPEAHRRLCTQIQLCQPEIVQVEGLEMMPYLLALKDAGYEGPMLIYDAHNAESLLQWRAFEADARRPARWLAALYSLVQTAKLRRYERQVLTLVDGVAAVSEADAAELRRRARGCVPYVIPNGVDIDAYDPATEYANPYPRTGSNLVFTGKMDFRPNVDGVMWFAERVLPRLVSADFAPHFWIVGQKPHDRLASLRNHPHITITGAVADIQPYIAHADVYVAPLLAGGGSRLKILEAFAMAKAVVSTTLGADGLGVSSGVELYLEDTPEAFAQRCAQLLEEPEIAREIGLRGRALVAAEYDWRRIVPRLEHLYITARRWRAPSDRA